jgi:hypothetical protein
MIAYDIRQANADEHREQLWREAHCARLAHEAVAEEPRGHRQSDTRIPLALRWHHLPSRT